MSDRIVLAGIRGRGFHGVFEHEKRDGQEFVVDLDVEAWLAPAGVSDDLAQTVNYGELGAAALARIEGEPFDLIEALAEVIAADVLTHRLVDAVTVTIHKPQAPVGVPFGDVTVAVTRRREPVPVVIALGANLGDLDSILGEAADAVVAEGFLTAARLSEEFESEPVGGPDQPAYRNAVLVGRTRWSAPRVLAALHAVEADFGRVREVRWGPRTLDLDLISWGVPGEASEWRSDLAELTLPHPRAHERAFVLVPWLEVDPSAPARVGEEVVPVADLVAGLDTSGVQAVDAGCGCGESGCGEDAGAASSGPGGCGGCGAPSDGPGAGAC